ncbi:MAG TPA: hypothetical protein VMN76_06245, partial [Acidobacteriota bacterium]|nr:hypothetical protein [Acidobacteriota bacterium]
AIRADFHIGDSNWSAAVFRDSVRYQEAGRDSAAPLFAPSDQRDRYVLALHELLQSEGRNESFARTILRESAGGYDLAAAAQSLGFKTTPARGNIADAYREAREKFWRIRQEHVQLSEKEAQLEALGRDLESCRRAGKRVHLLQSALEFLRRAQGRQAAARAVEEFPAEVSRLTGHEFERLQKLQGDLEEATRAARRLEAELDQLGQRQLRLELPAGGISAADLHRLRQQLGSLQELDRECASSNAELAEEEGRLQEAAAALGSDCDLEKLARLNSSQIGRLDEWVEQVLRVESRLQAAKSMRRILSPGNFPEPSRETLRAGLNALLNWLRYRRTGSGPSWLHPLSLLVSAFILILLAAWLSWSQHPVWALLALPGVLLLLSLLLQRGEGGSAVYRQEYSALDLPQPEEWEEGPVQGRLQQLQEWIGKAELAELVQRRQQDLAPEIEELQTRLQELQLEGRKLSSQIGLPELPGVLTLHFLAVRLAEFKKVREHVVGLKERVRHLGARQAELRGGLQSDLRKMGAEADESTASLSAEIDDLARRDQSLKKLEVRIEGVAQQLDQHRRTLSGLQAEIEGLRQIYKAHSGDEQTLRRWCDSVEDFREARERRATAEAQLAEARLRMESHPLFEPSLLDQSESALTEMLQQAEVDAQRLEQLQKQKAEVETLIRKARSEHNLEEALANREAAIQQLREQQLRDAEALAGNALREFLERKTKNYDRPQVFHSAREIFGAITRGRYLLEVQEGVPPAFRAFDTVLQTGCDLEELSSGTKVQLLLAVRLGFVETQEGGYRLPLIFDESLANSDEERSRALMEAALTMSRQGRQILCLTAQSSEMEKWRQVASGLGDQEPAVFDLARIRSVEESRRKPFRDVSPELEEIPDPKGLDHLGYGRKLRVPSIDSREPFGAVHVWHVVEEPRLLHRLLSMQVRTVGQLETLLTAGGEALLEGDEATPEEIRAILECLAHLFRLRKIGQGMPVDRNDLLDSGAVSERFIDEVSALAQDLRGDAQALLEAVTGVSRFRENKLKELEEFLILQGFIDPRPPISQEEARTRALARHAADIRSGRLNVATLERLLAEIFARSE